MTNVQASGDATNGAGDDRIIAFLFTDIEGSTGHAQRFPEGMRVAHERHDEIIRKAAETFGGDLFQSVGDGFKAAFSDPAAAVRAAFEAQRALQTVYIDDDGTILLRVRMAIHAGMTQVRNGEYVGLTPAKANRLVETIHGGQIVLTGETAEMVRPQLPDGATLQDIGEFKLRDFDVPDRLFQIAHPDLPANFPPLRRTDSVPNNLPNQLSHLIGRETETEDIRQRVVTFPLVTLTGAGGCGKTRLAIHVADRFLRKFPEGVWFIDLSHSDDAESIARTTADVLGIKPDADSPLIRQIVAHLAPLRCLLILDNCELIIDAAAGFAAELLKSCKDVRILATSREALGINGEALYPVHPLPYPPETLRDPKALMAYDSVRQFALQASHKSPTFRLTNENVFAVARICRRVDGIPLGVYLMASWSDTLTPAQMDAQMEKRFKFPKAAPGERTLPARHLTVRATIEYSLDLLTESERALLRRLAIFSGGWTLEAAEEICDGDPIEDVLESLTRLLRKSLIEAADAPFGKRYRLLQPIREYALELLAERNELLALRARHRDYFVRWATDLKPELTGKRPGDATRTAMQQADAEMDNLRVALAASTNVSNGLKLVAALFWHWRTRGYLREGIEWAERFLTVDDTSPVADAALRADARNGAGILYWMAGRLDEAQRRFSEAITLYRALNDDEAIAKMQSNLGSIAGMKGDLDSSGQYLQESLASYRRAGNEAQAAAVLNNLGALAERRNEYERAIGYFEEALAIHRRTGNLLSAAQTLHNLSSGQRHLKEWEKAREAAHECLTIRLPLDYQDGMIETIELMVFIVAGQARWEDAAALLGAASAMRLLAESPSEEEEMQELAAIRRTLSEKIGEDAVMQQELAGRLMNFAEVKARMFEENVGDPKERSE